MISQANHHGTETAAARNQGEIGGHGVFTWFTGKLCRLKIDIEIDSDKVRTGQQYLAAALQ